MRCFYWPIILAACALLAQDAPAPALNQTEARFQEALSGVTVIGFSANESGETREVRYVIERISKIGADLWKFEARIPSHGNEVKVALPLPVKWAGDTPVISVSKVPLPGLSGYSARVVIHDGSYAGMW